MSYYTVKVYGITCDAPGCAEAEEFVPRTDDDYKLQTARAQATQAGWSHRGGKDFCREHSDVSAVPATHT